VGPGTFARGGTFLPELARSKEGKAGASILEKELIGHYPFIDANNMEIAYLLDS
jgi:hypothetical protein